MSRSQTDVYAAPSDRLGHIYPHGSESDPNRGRRFPRFDGELSVQRAYHVIFVSTLQGIEPGIDERNISYSQRQAIANTRLEEAWAAFEAEQ